MQILPVLVMASACSRSHDYRPETDPIREDPTRDAEDAGAPAADDAAVEDGSAESADNDVAWVFAEAEDRLAIVGIRLQDGEMVPLRRDLPYAASEVQYATAYGLDLVHFSFADGRASVDAFGTPWVSVDQADADHDLEVRASDDGSLVWTSVHSFRPLTLERAQAARVHRDAVGDSAEVVTSVLPFYAYTRATDSSAEPDFLRFVGDYMLLLQGEDLYAARSDRAASAAPPDADLVLPNAGSVPAAFDTSLVVGLRDGAYAWVDYDGNRLTPANFRADATLRNGYQFVDQGLWRLQDRQVQFLLTLPDGASIDDVVAASPASPRHGARALLTDALPRLTLREAGNVLATYEPPAVDCQGDLPGSTAKVLGHTDLSSDGISVLLVLDHTCLGAEEGLGAGSSVDVWNYDARANRGRGVRIFTGESHPPGGFHLSESGRYAWAVTDDGNLLRVDTRSAETVTLDVAPDLVFWPVLR